MGRACEAGILAARLAKQGYTGPETILEGKFGFLDVYCRDGEAGLLTAKLNADWETMRICLKRYACHVTSHPPVQALRELMVKEKFSGGDVESINVESSDKVVSHHIIHEPNDIMQAQYSLPFNLALALYRDPDDAASFDESAVADLAIRALCRKIQVGLDAKAKTAWSSRMHVKLKDGRTLVAEGETFKGMPKDPLSRGELKRKFGLLMKNQGPASDRVFDHLASLEAQSQVLP
jgi:2-methylcitrate dehydratase PrpD